MRRPLFAICLCLVTIAALWLRLKNSSGERGEQVFAPPGEEITVTGRVCSKNTHSFIIDSINLIQLSDAASSRQIFQSKTKLICENKDALPFVRIGSTVMVKGTFAEFSGATNEGEFDGKSYYAGQNICGKLTDVVLCGESKKCSVVREGLHHLREYFKKRINQVFPEKEASLLVAMLLGDKGDLDREIQDLYRRSGIVHILSISGLHITLIGMSVYKLLRRLGMRIGLAAVCGGMLLCTYGVMTGMSLSACRAIGMYLIRMLAEIVGRSYDMLTALGVMAVFLVCSNPGNLGNAGFLFSFGAILGIGMLYPALLPKERNGEERYEPEPWKRLLKGIWSYVGKGLGQAVLSGTAITLFTLPIQLWFYYEIPVYSILLNVLVLPLMSPVMVSGLMAMLVPGAGMTGTVAYMILNAYEFTCKCFEKLPFHTWNPGKPDVWQVVVYYALLLLAVLWKDGNWREVLWNGCSLFADWMRRVRRKGFYKRLSEHGMDCMWRKGECKKKIGVVRYVILVLAVSIFTLRPLAEDRVTFLDVGQGDCILVETAEREVYLFDCGSSSRKQVGEYVLLPFLKYHGIRRIDGVFVSHFDEDHCNGIRELLAWGKTEGIVVEEVVVPEVSEQNITLFSYGQFSKKENVTVQSNIPISYMSAGEIYPSEGAFIFCLHPPQDYEEEGNAASMCFYVEFSQGDSSDADFFNTKPSDMESSEGDMPNAEFSLLLTGDVEGEGEKLLLQELVKRNIGAVDVLKVAHHGSCNATSERLLEQLSPKVAVISCGRNNRYGHPHAEVMERLEASGCEILSTAAEGQVTLEIDE